MIAIAFGILGAFAIRQIRNDAPQVGAVSDPLSKHDGLALRAADVLKEAEEADWFAEAAEKSFRLAASKRSLEAQYLAKHGEPPNKIITGTLSVTFEGMATSHLAEWNRRFADLLPKFAAFGLKVFVPSAPTNKVEGEPTDAAVKLICEREALAVVVDALRRADASTVSGAALQTRA